MTLPDTGPLLAILYGGDSRHKECVAALPSLGAPPVTTWICVTECMYMLEKAGGYALQEKLWSLLRSDQIEIIPIDNLKERVDWLMSKYRDTPMDLADASLVAAADALKQTKIFTLDSDFHVYRRSNGAAFEVVP